MRITMGIIGALMALAIPAMAAELPTIKFCSGAKDGNYDYSAIQIATQAKGVLNVQIINTAGSLENLAKLDSGACDVAIVQSDANYLFTKNNPRSSLNIERGRALYSEFVHFICNPAAKINRITELTSANTVLIGPNGGGSAVTWDSFKLADPKRYGPVQTLPIGGLRAVSRVQEGSDAQCMLYVTSLKSNGMMEANRVAIDSPNRLVLVPADDKDMPSIKDPKGKSMYTRTVIPAGSYPKGLQPAGMFGGTSEVGTIAVDAVVVTNTTYIDQNEAAYGAFLRAVNAAAPTITAHVTPH